MVLFSHKDDCKHGFKVPNFIHVQLSKCAPVQPIQVGMKVECTDLMDPRLVCVSTINRVVNRLKPFLRFSD